MRRFGRVLIFCASLAASLLVLEIGLRLWVHRSLHIPSITDPRWSLTERHPTRGWTFTPNATGTVVVDGSEIPVSINAHGLRDIPHAYEPRPGSFRIVVLGDSFMEAWGVELADSMPRRLEQGLASKSAEVINLGVRGYGTAQEYLFLKEEGLKYRPDLVVLAFFSGNDLRNNLAELEQNMREDLTPQAFGRPFARVEPAGVSFAQPDVERVEDYIAREERRFMSSRGSPLLLIRLLERRSGRKRKYDPNVFLGAYLSGFDARISPTANQDLDAAQYRRWFDQAWEVTIALVLETRDLAREHGAELVVLMVPPDYVIDEDKFRRLVERHPTLELDREAPDRRLSAAAAEHGFHYLDLEPVLRRAAERSEGPFYLGGDRHWNAAGHALAAEALIEYLERNDLVP